MNHHITPDEHAYCVTLVSKLQAIYDAALDYIESNKLDPAIFLPGNEWTGISPTHGLKFSTAYNYINYLRLNAPFAGYHLPILDRLDPGGKFARDPAEAFVRKLCSEGIPDDIAEQQKQFDARKRLAHVVPEYLDHISNVPLEYIVRTPRMFGEIGLDMDGVLVNPDVVLCQSRINGMYCSGILDKIARDIERQGRARVLEIGAGYGALAYALRQIFGPRLEYVVVDLTSSLYYAALYLSVLAGGTGCNLLGPGDAAPERFQYLFVPNYMLDKVFRSLGRIDVAINTMSFPEMSAPQIFYYGNCIKQLIGEDGVVFEENGVVHPHHVDCKAIFANIFPYHRHVTSRVVVTKNWCQDVWASRYLGPIFDRSDVVRGPPLEF